MGREPSSVRRAFRSVLLAVGLCAAESRPARADALDDAMALARKGLVSRLESLAAWAQEQKISGFRHRLYRRILELDPDHAKSRSALQYRRASKKDPWVQDPSYEAPADWARSLLPEAEKRLGAVHAWYRDAVIEATAAESERSPSRTDEILERLLDQMPEDPELRRIRGHVEKDGRWALPETHRARERRAALVRAGADAREEARKRIKVDLEAEERNWIFALRTPTRRVLGTLRDESRARDALAFMEAADVVVPQVLGKYEAVIDPDFDEEEDPGVDVRFLYIFETEDEARSFVSRSPDVAELRRDLPLVSALPLGGGAYLAIKRGEVGIGVRTSGVRYVVDRQIDRAAPGRGRGWISEGLGQRIVWYATGIHGTSFVSLRGTERNRAGDEEGEEDLPEEPDAWLAAAARVLDRDAARRLTTLLTMRLNAMRPSDVLASYALAAYLAEGRPDALVAFARASQESDDAAAVVRKALDMDLGALAWRLRRWLRDTP